MIKTAGSNPYYLIPIQASVHTHSNCRQDNTDGVSKPIGDEDKEVASRAPNIKHWIIGCEAIAEYDAEHNRYFNVQTGSLGQNCDEIAGF